MNDLQVRLAHIFNLIDSQNNISDTHKQGLKQIVEKCITNIPNFNEKNLLDVLNRGDFSVSINPNLRARGHYSVANNTFALREDFDNNLPTALHEFLHLASTPQKINFTDSNNYEHETGICEYGKENGESYQYATQLNEGITEWLTQKCFGGAYRGSYFFESKIASILDKTVFEGKLTEAYFEGNTDKIFETLEQNGIDTNIFMEMTDLLDRNHKNNEHVVEIENMCIDMIRQKSLNMLETSTSLADTQAKIKQMLSIVQSDMVMQNNSQTTLNPSTIGQFPESTLSNLSLVDSSFNECLVSIKQKNIELKKEQEKPLSTEPKSFREQYSLPEEEKRRLAIYSKETAERIATETPQPDLSQEEYTY